MPPATRPNPNPVTTVIPPLCRGSISTPPPPAPSLAAKLPTYPRVIDPCSHPARFSSPTFTRGFVRGSQQTRGFSSQTNSSTRTRNTKTRLDPINTTTDNESTAEEKKEQDAKENEDIMSQKLIPSDPASVMVIRNVRPNIVTFSVPFSRFGTAKIGGRGTLVKLTSGALAIFSPVALTEQAKAKVAEMGGQVRYIVALDYEHHIFMSEWAKAYPEAKLIGPEGLAEKRHKMNDDKIGNEEFAVEFKKEGKRNIKIDPEFDADFEYEYVDGHANLELVFLYKPDRVLIEADLFFNLPAKEQYSKAPEEEHKEGRIAKLFSGVQSPQGDATWMRRLNWYLIAKDRASFNESVQLIYKWDFDTIIPCHGDVAEGDGKELFHKVFTWHIDGKK